MMNETGPGLGQHARTGWKDSEEAFLFSEVEKKRAAGEPLRAAFEAVAHTTGRKPNSIRNYYYAKLRSGAGAGENILRGTAFVPFGEDETRALLRTVLTERAKGTSVRACTLAMGGGDTKTMLRYQNKYRALLRTNPALVKEVRAELMEAGLNVPDPYGAMKRRRQVSSESTPGLAEAAAEALSGVQGIDAAAFFRTLTSLASAAKANGEKEAEKGAGESAGSGAEEELKRLTLRLRELTAVCRSFLTEAEQDALPPAGGYYDALCENVADSERMLGMIS